MYSDKGERQRQISERSTLQSFSGDVLVFSAGTGLLVFFGFIQTFIIPKYLSMESYGYWQLFRLYANYVGILHFGFIDGILVRWAGKELTQIGKEIKIALRFLFLEQLVVIVPLCLVSYFLFRPPTQWIGLMLLTYTFISNLMTFFMFTSQAIRKFKMLTLVTAGRGLWFLLLIILLFVSGYFDYYYVIFAFIFTFLIALAVFALWFHKYLWDEISTIGSLLAYGKRNINIGIFVMLGNLILILFLTVDRLMVSFFFSIEQFAIYGFALTVIMVVYTLVQAISQVFFPYLSASRPEGRARTYQLGRFAIVLACAAILVIYFPLVKLIEFYLPHYVASLPILQILICTVIFSSMVQIIHINYYKAYGRQRQYFLWGIIALALSIILIFLAIKIVGTLESVAITTVISFGVWYFMNELGMKSVVKQDGQGIGKALVGICCYLGAFWLSTFVTENFISRMLIYISLFLLITWALFRTDVKTLVMVAKEIRNKRQ
jgi:O-antigen/teichoic acid export membrane protein